MRILLDHCVDIRFKSLLEGHDIAHTKEMGWETLSNGALLDSAEATGFEVFITVDKNLRHQQDLSRRKLAVVTLASRFTGLDDIQRLVPQVLQFLGGELTSGTSYVIDEPNQTDGPRDQR
ncbi:MAG: hypothetical protein K1X67_12675 [Fimbriimonadaceae bacterium]|nr:hypothetical protein [Fimbriimonadaceae bacterium]